MRRSLTRPPASHTAPQSGSGIFHRWSEFQLFAVAGGRYQQIQRENLRVSPFRKVAVVGDFPEFYGSRCEGQFSPPGVKSGVSFSSALTATAKSADQGGDIYEFQEEHHARRTNKFACEPPLRHSNSSQRCVLWTVAVCSSSWRGNRAWLGDKQLARITPKDVQRFYDQLGDSLASGTVRRIHTTLHGALKAAQLSRSLPDHDRPEMRLHRRGRDPVRRHHLLLHVRRDTQQCQLLCVTKYEPKRCIPGSVERTVFLFIGRTPPVKYCVPVNNEITPCN